MDRLLLVLKGFCMGTADVVPGVSGGTMAFILGIYERLIAAIKSFDLECLKKVFSGDIKGAILQPHWGFILPLFLGIFMALIFFTRVISLPTLITTHPELIYGLFFGLILGSIFVLLKHIPKIDPKGWAFILAGIIIGLLIVTLTPKETPETSWFIFFCGALAITAMILPGISGSFILLILGKYAYIINALGHFELRIAIPFALGAAIGLAFFSRFLHWLLQHFHTATLLVINGILIGSLWIIWPFQQRIFVEVRGKQKLIESHPILPHAFDNVTLTAFGLMFVGFALVIAINTVSEKIKN